MDINKNKSLVSEESNSSLRMGRTNLYFILAGVLMVIVGLIVMMVGPNSSLNHFEPDIFSFRRIVLAPMIIFVGYLFVIVAICLPTKK